MDLTYLKDKKPEIFFDEWEDKWVKIHIDILQNGKVKLLDKTEYIVFEGKVMQKDNPFRIDCNINCIFWISKKMFELEIIRHLNFDNNEKPFDLDLEMRRPSKHKLQIRNVTKILLR